MHRFFHSLGPTGEWRHSRFVEILALVTWLQYIVGKAQLKHGKSIVILTIALKVPVFCSCLVSVFGCPAGWQMTRCDDGGETQSEVTVTWLTWCLQLGRLHYPSMGLLLNKLNSTMGGRTAHWEICLSDNRSQNSHPFDGATMVWIVTKCYWTKVKMRYVCSIGYILVCIFLTTNYLLPI